RVNAKTRVIESQPANECDVGGGRVSGQMRVVITLGALSLGEPMAEIQAAPKHRNRRAAASWRGLRTLIARRRGGDQTDGEGERENEPDQPHGHLVEDGWRESSRPRLIAGAGRVGRARATRSPGRRAGAASAGSSGPRP